MENITIKNNLKTLGAEIRETRKEHKEKQRNTGKGMDYTLNALITEYRSLHIAYGLIRGKEYKQIEKYTRPGNEPKWNKILLIVESFAEQKESIRNRILSNKIISDFTEGAK